MTRHETARRMEAILDLVLERLRAVEAAAEARARGSVGGSSMRRFRKRSSSRYRRRG